MARESHVILCALSDLKRPYSGVAKSFAYMTRGFSAGAVGDEYNAYYTNEGPVKLLLDKANREGNRVDRIVYLCSDKCKTERIELEEGSFTAETYFTSQVGAFVRGKLHLDWIGDEKSFFHPIPYEVGDADKCLSSVIGALGQNVTVDVDVSGAQRDAQLLIAHAIEFVQIGNDNVCLGATVYANFNSEPKTLTCLDGTYRLSRLIGSIDSFVRYGRAEGLSEYFANGCEEVRTLCDSMSDFSADLSVCRVNGIQDAVTRVHDAIDMLEKRAASGGLNSGETLLAALAPNIRMGFVKRTDTDFERTWAIIRWCVEHDMLQQALSLYRESFFVLLSKKGLIRRGSGAANDSRLKWYEGLLGLSDSWAKDGVCCYPGINERERRKRRRCAVRINLQDDKASRVLATDDQCRPVLCANFAWFYLLRTIRNDVMHASSETSMDKRLEFIDAIEKVMVVREGFDPQYDRAVKSGLSRTECNRALAKDVLNALRALDGEARLLIEID